MVEQMQESKAEQACNDLIDFLIEHPEFPKGRLCDSHAVLLDTLNRIRNEIQTDY